MPSRPARLCVRCRAIRTGDKCQACGWAPSRWADRQRGKTAERGYGWRWQQLRKRKLQHNPLCEACLTKGITQEAEEVHHVQPFQGIGDPLRLRWDNLVAMCRPCHREETAGRAG